MIQSEVDKELGIFQEINKYLFQEIIQYLDIKDRVNMKLSSGIFNQIVQISKVSAQRVEPIKVTNNQAQLYLKCPLPEQYNKILGIYVSLETKDQGWASVQHSSSWVTLQLLKEDSQYSHNLKALEEILLAENFQEKKYKTVKHLMLLNEERQDLPSLNYIFMGLNEKKFNGVGVIMKCLYPGWECHIARAQIDIFYE